MTQHDILDHSLLQIKGLFLIFLKNVIIFLAISMIGQKWPQ
jgi:hypothetical protein